MSEVKPWILPQVERMALERPGRIASALAAIFAHDPELEAELTAMAVEEDMVDLNEAAVYLNISPDELERRVAALREPQDLSDDMARIKKDVGGVARLVSSPVAIWEVVREYRRVGAVDQVLESMPMLSELDVRAALSYAGRNPDEIGREIKRYDDHVERTRAAYPFADAR